MAFYVHEASGEGQIPDFVVCLPEKETLPAGDLVKIPLPERASLVEEAQQVGAIALTSANTDH